jgi:hypothetical protein
MPKESGPQNGGMGRRDFLKATTYGVAGVSSLDTSVQAQEKKVLDDSLRGIVFLALSNKINYPDKFKPITPEAECILLGIQNYKSSYLAEQTLDKHLTDSGNQSITANDNIFQIIADARRALFKELKKIDPNLKDKDYSDEIFYHSLAYRVPEYLADYGIYARPSTFDAANPTDPTTGRSDIVFSEILMEMGAIDRIERDEVEQGGFKVKRNAIFVKGPVVVNGQIVNYRERSRVADTGFGNIFIFEKVLQDSLDSINRSVEGMKKDVAKNNGQFVNAVERELRDKNQWSGAAQVAMVKIIQKLKTVYTYEQHKEEQLIHETNHLISGDDIVLRQIWFSKHNTDFNESNRNYDNFRIHDEIDPLIAQLKYNPARAITLFFYLAETRGNSYPGGAILYVKSKEWIIHNMVDVIQREGVNKYGIELSSDINVSIPNQILSQLYVLLEQPELFGELCDKLVELHKAHLGDDLLGIMPLIEEQKVAPKPIESITSKIKVPAGVAITTGAAAYGLKKLHDRKKKVAEEEAKLKGMTRTERREYERKKKKGKE